MLIQVTSVYKFTTDRGYTFIDGNPDDSTKGVYDVPAEIGDDLISKGRAILFVGKAPVVPDKPETTEAPPETGGGWKGNPDAGITDNTPAEDSEGTDGVDGDGNPNPPESGVSTDDAESDESETTEDTEPDIVVSLNSVIAECEGKEEAEAKSLLDDWAVENLEAHIDKRKGIAKVCEELKELVSENSEG